MRQGIKKIIELHRNINTHHLLSQYLLLWNQMMNGDKRSQAAVCHISLSWVSSTIHRWLQGFFLLDIFCHTTFSHKPHAYFFIEDACSPLHIKKQINNVSFYLSDLSFLLEHLSNTTMSTEASRTSTDGASNASTPDKVLTMSFNQDSTYDHSIIDREKSIVMFIS